MRTQSCRKGKRKGFTLIELVVVVLIIGIIAAVAAPKMFDTAGDARANSARQSLAVLRDAIELYRTQNGAYPGADGEVATFKADVKTYMRGGFPNCPVGNTGDTVRIAEAGTALAATGTESWAYDNVSGEIIINHADYSAL